MDNWTMGKMELLVRDGSWATCLEVGVEIKISL